MARLIDADELKKEITSAFHGVLGVTIRIAMHGFIDKQPTIDPESLRPHGKWARVKGDSGGQVGYRCSCCGSKWPIVQFFVYCPYCGAKMEDGGLTMKHIVDRIGLPATLEQTAEECAELAHACLKEARRLRGENPTPKTTPECWLAISEELTDVQICIEMLEAAGYHGDPAMADVKRQRMAQRLDEDGK